MTERDPGVDQQRGVDGVRQPERVPDVRVAGAAPPPAKDDLNCE